MKTAQILPFRTLGSSPSNPSGGVPAVRGELSILLLEDDPADAKLFVWYAGKIGIEPGRVTHATTIEAAERLLAGRSFDLLVIDFWVGPDSSAAFIGHCLGLPDGPPLIVLSNLSPEEMAEAYRPSPRMRIVSKSELSTTSLGRTLGELVPSDGAAVEPLGKERCAVRFVLEDIQAIVNRLEGFVAVAEGHLSAGDPEVAHGVILAAGCQVAALKAKIESLTQILPEADGAG
jgi:hypothetical protein